MLLNKFIKFITVCTLVAAVASCEKPGAENNDNDDDKKEEQTEPEQPEEVEKLPTAFLSAKETVANMGAGWNLGNTLDSNSGDVNNMWIEGWGPATPESYEKAWGQAPATRELFHMLKKKGFKSIRIPVTWYPHIGTITTQMKEINGVTKPTWDMSTWTGNDVDPKWMKRVKEVVDYVLAEDMYCILNVHHDTGTASTHWVVADEANYAQYNDKFKSLWNQIATEFKDYDGRLLFEGYNEMTDVANSWCFASFGANGGYDAAIASSAYNAVNAYAQDFVDVVRSTGGNNAERNLIVNTYAACSGEGTWNTHLKEPLTNMKLPKDSAKDHLAFQVHYYPKYTTLTEYKKSVDNLLSGLDTYLASKGAPVIIGEWSHGEVDEDNKTYIAYNYKRQDFLSFAQYFVQQAKTYGYATFYWMGISDGAAARKAPRFTQEDLADAIVKGAK